MENAQAYNVLAKSDGKQNRAANEYVRRAMSADARTETMNVMLAALSVQHQNYRFIQQLKVLIFHRWTAGIDNSDSPEDF